MAANCVYCIVPNDAPVRPLDMVSEMRMSSQMTESF